LDIENSTQLLDYLRRTHRIGADEHPRVEVLAGGVSNRTVLVERESGESWVLKQALEKLRVSVDWFSDRRRIEREALGMEHLARLTPPGTIPVLVFVDPASHLLAMQAVPQPHENWKSMLMAGKIDPDHLRQFASILASIHNRSARIPELASLFSDRSFFESLRLEPYYLYTAHHVPAAADFLNNLVAECRSRRLCLVHGDYSPKNILIRENRLVLLDHEVIHYGDPAFDLGFALAHLLSKAHHLAHLRSEFAAAACQFWHEYASQAASFDELDRRAVAHTLGCLLARAAGRSQLEYLTPAEKHLQQSAVLSLIAAPPQRVYDLIAVFVAICR
jgi:5-methylthioribose kinase